MKLAVVVSCLFVACGGAGDEMRRPADFVEAPTDGANSAGVATSGPRAKRSPAVAASASDDSSPAQSQSIDVFNALLEASCPATARGAVPTALSAGGQSRWGAPPRRLDVLINEIQQLEQSLPLATSAYVRDQVTFKLAADYYDLEVSAYQECAKASAPPPKLQRDVEARAALVRSRAKTMEHAARAGMKHCAMLAGYAGFGPPSGFVAPGPCPF